jgi:hypothetical protein
MSASQARTMPGPPTPIGVAPPMATSAGAIVQAAATAKATIH